MQARPDVFDFLACHMIDPNSQWSIGSFGAIAEFMRDHDEPAEVRCIGTSLSAITPRGAICIEHSTDLRPVGLEFATGSGWNQRVALCLPAERCAMNHRSVLTELGPDHGAMRDEDKSAILFDVGLDALQVDVTVRVADTELASQLRPHAGRSLFEPNNPAMGIILNANPHRVFIGRLGRVEVFQPIPPADGTSPQGPHTHVLPKLLKLKRTHPATEPIPQGWVPAAYLYPAHPLKDADGLARLFERTHHAAFQDIMRSFGDPDWMRLKDRVMAAVAAGEGPFKLPPRDRFARLCVRVALRQIEATGAPARSLPVWIAAYGNERHAEALP